MARIDGRAPDQLRPLRIEPGYLAFANGSALIELGMTWVICAATVETRVPSFLRGSNSGWVTAEYSMLPRSTLTRTPREVQAGRVGGRTQEIQRLIGRSLRAVVDLPALGERTITLDCDVIQADGGTRTAAITGAYVALHQALSRMVENGELLTMPLKSAVAAVSVGMLNSDCLLDLCYEEDCRAEVDFNVVMTDRGHFVEVQGTAERKPFTKDELGNLTALAETGIRQLVDAQRAVLAQHPSK